MDSQRKDNGVIIGTESGLRSHERHGLKIKPSAIRLHCDDNLTYMQHDLFKYGNDLSLRLNFKIYLASTRERRKCTKRVILVSLWSRNLLRENYFAPLRSFDPFCH